MPSWPARREVTRWTWTQIELAMGGQTGPPTMRTRCMSKWSRSATSGHGTNSVIDLSTPSPSPKKRKTSSAWQVPNPDNAVLGLPDADEAQQSVEEALEEMMDALPGDQEWDWWFLQRTPSCERIALASQNSFRSWTAEGKHLLTLAGKCLKKPSVLHCSYVCRSLVSLPETYIH